MTEKGLRIAVNPGGDLGQELACGNQCSLQKERRTQVERSDRKTVGECSAVMRGQPQTPDWMEYGRVREEGRGIIRREVPVLGSVTGVQGGERKSGGQRCGGTKELAEGSAGLARKGALFKSLNRVWSWDEGEIKEEVFKYRARAAALGRVF